ncbi:MAG: hypothetical protein WBP51_02880 [Candidatus Sulfotelmatobacter sp.]
MEKSFDITLEVLGDALDLRAGKTRRHSERITAFTMAIARAMDLPREQIMVIAPYPKSQVV